MSYPTSQLISIVVPTRNRPHLLPVTLRTLLAQRQVSFEVIVVDDGSDTPVAEAVPAIRDTRVRVVRHNRSQGMSAARNTGIAAAAGRWIAFCDDDDLWAPGKLEAQLSALGRSGRVWAYTGIVYVDADLRVVFGEPPIQPEAAVANLVRSATIPAGASNVIVRRELLQEAGGFDPEFVHIADWDMWMRLAEKSLPAYVPAPLVAYRQHRGNMSLRGSEMFHELVRLEQRRPALEIEWPAFMRWVAERHLQGRQTLRALGWLGRSVAAERTATSALHALRTLAAHYRHLIVTRAGASRRRRAPPLYADWWREAEAWLGDVDRA